MKTRFVISAVVVAVLATVVVEETRIAKMREQIVRLQAVPDDAPRSAPKPLAPAAAPAAPATDTPPQPVKVRVKDGQATPVEDGAQELPSGGFREVPADYPEPDEERIRALALGPYAQLQLELALTPRESAYFDDLLTGRARTQQELAAKWLGAGPAGRGAVAAELADAIAGSDEALRRFLKRDADFETFAAFHALQPDRELLAQLAPLMDSSGVSLSLDKERELVAAMHRARIGTGGIDWNSPEALDAMTNGGVAERFESEWSKQGEALEGDLRRLLTEEEAAAFREARQQVGESRKAALAEAAQSLGG